MKWALKTPGEAKSSWRTFAELMLRQRATTPYFSSADVMREISQIIPWYANVNYEELPEEGLLLQPHIPQEPNINYLEQTFQKQALQLKAEV